MAFVQAAPFSFRDFLRSILPGLIAAGLFVPYTGASRNEELVLGIALLSYVIYTPLSKLANVFRLMPIVGGRVRALDEDLELRKGNWDYKRLFYLATTEEREYLYLTAAYLDFYRLTALYFLAYLVTQLAMLAVALGAVITTPDRWYAAVKNEGTPMLGGWDAPTSLVALVAFVILWFLLADFLNEYRILFGDQYDQFARRYHAESGGVVTSIWGRVTKEGFAVDGAIVTLKRSEWQRSERTDKAGRFRFSQEYQSCFEHGCTLSVAFQGHRASQELLKGDKWIPPVELRLVPEAKGDRGEGTG
ncbi:MAG TPA: hypothetical protein VNJ70_14220 [Thermoanaerobaculia bacterium]|nr:hypothetical protein [Thermoanaerobaculia bacterium]